MYKFGPNPKEVTEIVLKDSRFINILGNNEISLFDIDKNDTSSEVAHRAWTKTQISEYMDDIKKLPETNIVEINGLKLLMIHAQNGNANEKPLIYENNMQSFENNYKDFETNFVLFGHTHEKMLIEYHNKIYLNPGSLGCSFNKNVDFAILELEDGEFEKCTFESLKYDKNLVINDYLKYEVPDREFILKIFYGYSF